MRGMRLQLIPLFKGLQITTDGAPLSPTTLNLNVPQVTNLLPYCEALFLIGLTTGIADNQIEWNVRFFSGFDRNNELTTGSPPYPIASANFTLGGSARSADYTTLTNFLPESRLQLWWQNKSGVNGVKNATVSAILGARLFGS